MASGTSSRFLFASLLAGCFSGLAAYIFHHLLPRKYDLNPVVTIAEQAVAIQNGPRKGFLKHFCKLFLQNNDEKQQNHIVFNDFFHYLHQYFCIMEVF